MSYTIIKLNKIVTVNEKFNLLDDLFMNRAKTIMKKFHKDLIKG